MDGQCNYRPMPVVGPPIPGPLGDPLDPLPIEPDPGDTGLVPGLVPDAPALLPEPLDVASGHSACFAVPAVPPEPDETQSALLPDAAAPCGRDVPDEPPMLESEVEPPPDAGGVFGSTELPEPRVLELVPEVGGVEVCPNEIPAFNSSASNKEIDRNAFIISPAKILMTHLSQGMCLLMLLFP